MAPATRRPSAKTKARKRTKATKAATPRIAKAKAETPTNLETPPASTDATVGNPVLSPEDERLAALAATTVDPNAPRPGYMRCNACIEPRTCSFEERCAYPKMAEHSAAADATEPPMGRPTTFDPILADEIIEWMSGGKSLVSYCAQDGKPARSTVFRWLGLHRDFSDSYSRAREAQADAIFDDCLDIADGKNADVRLNDAGALVVDGEVVRRSQVRIDTRLKVAARLHPRRYSERLALDVNDQRADTPDTRKAEIARLMALGFAPSAAPTDDVPAGV